MLNTTEDEQGFRTPEILQEDEIVPEPTGEGISITLPTFVQIEKSQFLWGDCDGETFMSLLNRTYDEVVHWRKNVFHLPSGKFGKMFVSELSRLFNAYYPGSCLEGVTLKAAMTLPILVLQKPFATSKTCDHVQCLERRLKLWQKGDLEALLEEGRSIQHRLSSSHINRRVNSTSVTFSKLMLEGKVRATLRLLNNQECSGPLKLDQRIGSKCVRDILLDKHPAGRPLDSSAVIPPSPHVFRPHPVYYDCITGSLIHAVALHVDGAAGPSNLDAHDWRRICTSYHSASADICNALASFARHLCTELWIHLVWRLILLVI